MSVKDNFTPEEWDKVLSGPATAAAAILAASPSGLTGIIAEGITTVKAMKELAEASSAPLLQAIAASLKPEDQERHREERPRFKSFEEAKNAMLERLRSAFWIVQTKATPEDLAAYQQYVVGVAERVAQAAKEGGFLGIGGEQVSQAEKDTLKEIRATVGLQG